MASTANYDEFNCADNLINQIIWKLKVYDFRLCEVQKIDDDGINITEQWLYECDKQVFFAFIVSPLCRKHSPNHLLLVEKLPTFALSNDNISKKHRPISHLSCEIQYKLFDVIAEYKTSKSIRAEFNLDKITLTNKTSNEITEDWYFCDQNKIKYKISTCQTITGYTEIPNNLPPRDKIFKPKSKWNISIQIISQPAQ